MGWTAEIGSVGGALSEYPIADFGFVKRLNAVGFGHLVISGLDGNSEPVRGDAVRLIWDKGGSDEEVHFEGIVFDKERLGTSPYRALTLRDIPGYYGWISQTSESRHYESLTPHDIIQGTVTPNNLLTNAAGTQVLTYGTSASVPNKVDATNPGERLDDFVADGRRLILNWQRLCLQSRYGTATTPDGSYGLEFFGQFEGANNSTPRIYFVKRVEQSPSPSETFNVPDDAHQAQRGEEGATAADVMRVVGGGHGESQVQSGIVGSGGLEGVQQDKSIIGTTNATNAATRLQGLLDPGNESVMAWSHKHNFSSRVGDTVTLTQSGFSNKSLRIFETGYNLRNRLFLHQLGRPRALERDPFYQLEAMHGGHGSVGQKRGGLLSANSGISSISIAAAGDEDSVTATFSPTFDAAVHDGVMVYFLLTVDTPGADFDIELTLSDGSTVMDIQRERVTTRETGSGTGNYSGIIHIDDSLINAIGGGLTTVAQVKASVTNRTGAVASASVLLQATITGG